MRGFIRLGVFATYMAVLVACCPAHSLAQTPEDRLANRTLSLRLTDANFMYVLGTLSVLHRIPIGLEVAAGRSVEPKLNIEVSNATLETVLDLITRQYPAYRWEIRDGVVNFVPRGSRDPFLARLLETRVGRFAPAKGANKFGIRDAITDLPEVENLLRVHEMTVWKLGYPSRRSVYSDDEVDLTISDTDVRGVLNKVVRDSEHKLWVVRRKGEKNEILQISL